MNEILKKLLRNYYIWYILLVLSAVAGFYLAPRVQLDETDRQSITTIGIVLLLASIPYAFHYYKKQVEKLKPLGEDEQLRKISKVVNVRLAIVAVPLMYNIVMFYLTANMSLIFAAGMSALVLIYIKPSKNIFLKDLTNENNTTEKNEEQ